MRGMSQIGTHSAQSQFNSSIRVICLPLPPMAFSALRPLMTVSAPSPLASNLTMARFTLHYLGREFGQRGRVAPGARSADTQGTTRQ
jgi:hypothetical protein